MRRLFVDTSGWMAMADGKDPFHEKSIRCRDEWLEKNAIIVTTNFIIDETLTLIRMRLGIEATKKWWQLISDSPRCLKEWITPERTEKAVHWFFNWYDQSFSFTDCTSFVVMRDLGITDVLTTDNHFTIAGFRTHP